MWRWRRRFEHARSCTGADAYANTCAHAYTYTNTCAHAYTNAYPHADRNELRYC
jgi:hypothetical protein